MNNDKKISLKSSHTPAAIRARLDAGVRHSYLKDFIYGAIDGAVTTFAVVCGVAGAGLPPKIIIILGAANLVGDGFSMAAGNFLATRSEEQRRGLARRIEEDHIEEIPEGEREEIRQIFAAKGFKGGDLEKVVDVITADRKRWVDTMLTEELGVPLDTPSAWKAAFATFAAFIIIGSLPLLAFINQLIFPKAGFDPFVISSGITGTAFFIVGALKARFVGQKWYAAGLEAFAVGSCAAVLAYAVGVFLGAIVQ